MGFGSVDANAEEGGDLLVGFTFGKKLENFAFTRSETRTWRLGAVGGRDGELVGKRVGEASGEIGLVLTSGVDGGEEDTIGFVLENVTTSAGLDDLLNKVVGFMHGEDENFGGGRSGANAASGFDSVEERHADVEDSHVGLKLGGLVNGVTAVGSFGADFPAGARLEESAKTSANHGMIIRDQDAKSWHRRSPSGRREVG